MRHELEREPSVAERADLELIYSRAIDDQLDAGYGSCALGDPRIAEMVLATVLEKRGVEMALEAVAVMPNHLHLVLSPLEGLLCLKSCNR